MPAKLLLQVRDLNKSFGEKHIFENANVSISERQKIGVIGRNGAGKTTFFKMILGKEEADGGEILKMPDLKLGYIEQHDPFLPEETVIDFLQRYTGKEEWECAKIAGRFQLKNEKLAGKIADLSGGYQMRVKLTATLLFEPNLLLLDEPTNYLDLSTLILLEQFLKDFRGGFMVITHDREFIKKTCNETLDVDHGQLFLHPEPLEDYLQFKAEQKELAESVNLNIERKQKQLQTFVDRFGAKANMAKSAQSKLKQIQKLDNKKINIVNPFATVKMYIPPIEAKAGVAVECKDLTIGYLDLPDAENEREKVANSLRLNSDISNVSLEKNTNMPAKSKIIASGINFDIERGKKLAILGDNGQGKSTLLKTLAGKLSPISGQFEWKSGLKVAYYNQMVGQSLNPKETVFEYIQRVANKNSSEEDRFRVLSNFLFKKNDRLKPISVLSGGEKARLCMAGMFLSGADVYLLDEPTNHLDFETVEAMGEALGKFNGTVIVISHDRTFVSLIANEIMEIRNGQIKRVLGSYEDYVWQLEQEAENNNSANHKLNDQINKKYERDFGLKSAKEVAREVFELKRELNKIEKKIKNSQNLLNQGKEVDKNQAIINDCEIRWLEVQEKIQNLEPHS